uniref:Transmembrane protein 45B n=1 Tax=Trichobilharzia regenti TaxID=157069 RepID=A0AA85KCG9_TRIRE|nr:unnamed protein product [Trichobilharzia regenti]
MGTFAGHVFPGSVFIFFGLWSVWNIAEKFSRRKRYELNRSRESIPLFINRISFPIVRKTSILKILCCVIVLCEEVQLGFKKDWTDVDPHSAQHVSMISLFGVSGVAEVCILYGVLKIPVQSEYFFTFMALLGEFFLFMFHLHGRSPLDVYIHLLLAGMVALGVVLLLCELIAPHQPVYGIMRSWTYLMQGTWFWQIAATLYPTSSWMPIWNHSAPQSLASAANSFAYHMVANFFAIILIFILIRLRHRVGFISNKTVINHLSSTVEAPAGNSVIRRENEQQNYKIQTLQFQSFTPQNDAEEFN